MTMASCSQESAASEKRGESRPPSQVQRSRLLKRRRRRAPRALGRLTFLGHDAAGARGPPPAAAADAIDLTLDSDGDEEDEFTFEGSPPNRSRGGAAARKSDPGNAAGWPCRACTLLNSVVSSDSSAECLLVVS